MDAQNPARFAASRTSLSPKTRRIGNVLFRQFMRAQNLFAMKIRYRHFRSRRKKELIIFQAVHVGFEFRQLRCSGHAIAPHQKRRAHLFVTMLAGVQIEHEVDQTPLQTRPRAGETNKAAAACFVALSRSNSLRFVPMVTWSKGASSFGFAPHDRTTGLALESFPIGTL